MGELCIQRPTLKGLLELFVLAECNRKPNSGKQLMETVARITAGRWKPGSGAIYPLLSKLEKKGLLAPLLAKAKGRREINYSITASGRRFFAHEKKHFGEEVERLMTSAWPLMAKVMYNCEEANMAEIEAHFKGMEKLKKALITMPNAKRILFLRRLSKSVNALAKEM